MENKRMKLCLPTLALCLCHFLSPGQNSKIDSLLTLLKTEKEDTNHVNTLNTLSRELSNNNKYDRGIENANKAIGLSQKLAFKKGEANGNFNIGVAYYFQSDFAKALDYHLKALKLYEETGNKKGIGNRSEE